jgi:glycosyltransferase involved in cell wall biosynthesis
LLKQSLESILAQTFSDFEVLVGNDYTEETLTGEMLGITDSRIKYVNHPVNLREIGNMNALLNLASGRYFTWLFDDDLFEPAFLQIGYDTLTENNFPDAFFSSYRVTSDAQSPPPFSITPNKPMLLTGVEFLQRYSASRPDIISTCGLFQTYALRTIIGGIAELSDSAIGLYSEYHLLVSCGKLRRIVFVNAPLVIFRAHSGSWSESNMELDKYPTTGKQLIRKCEQILRHPDLTNVYQMTLIEICKTHLFTFYNRAVFYELAQKHSKISKAIRYRLRYYKEVYATGKLYAELTGLNRRHCIALFLRIMNHYHIAPPDWSSASPTNTAQRGTDA